MPFPRDQGRVVVGGLIIIESELVNRPTQSPIKFLPRATFSHVNELRSQIAATRLRNYARGRYPEWTLPRASRRPAARSFRARTFVSAGTFYDSRAASSTRRPESQDRPRKTALDNSGADRTCAHPRRGSSCGLDIGAVRVYREGDTFKRPSGSNVSIFVAHEK